MIHQVECDVPLSIMAPINTVIYYLHDKKPKVRKEAAWKGNDEQRLILCNDPDKEVRKSVAWKSGSLGYIDTCFRTGNQKNRAVPKKT